jgi:group I intron endonuclease
MSKTPKISCIYKIVNNINGKIYIGSAVDFKRRKRDHLYQLKKGIHHSKYLQRGYNKHGFENFNFSILEIVENHSELLETGININSIRLVCTGKRNKAGGFKWEYKDKK